MTPHNFETIAALLRNGSGLMIGPDKLYLLETRLAPMLRAHRLADLDALAAKLRAGAAALERDVIEAMTTNESSFFRDDRPFTHVRTQSLPRLHATRAPGAKLRIWSAAASTGQEAYSIAMMLAEDRAKYGTREVEIVGTDIAREPLARARLGLYSQFEVQRGLPVQLLLKYFRKEEGNWRIADSIRGMANFREYNLLGDLRALGTLRPRVLPQRADLLRSAHQGARAGGDRAADGAGRTAVSGRRGDGARRHRPLRASGGGSRRLCGRQPARQSGGARRNCRIRGPCRQPSACRSCDPLSDDFTAE